MERACHSMKRRFLSLFVLLSLLLSLPALAEPDDSNQPLTGNLFDDVFMRYSAGVGVFSFNEVDAFLPSTDFSVESVAPSEKDWASHKVEDGSGDYVNIMYFPLDTSYDSKDYGNPDKEVISSVSFHRGNRSVTVTSDMHTSPVTYKTYDNSRDPANVEVYDLNSLLDYFVGDMKGKVLGDYSDSHSVSTSTGNEVKVELVIDAAAKEYRDTDITSIRLASNQSTPSLDDVNVAVEATWSLKNSKESTEETLRIFSDDLAVRLAEGCSFVSEMRIHWTVPYLSDRGVIAKFTYEMKSGAAYRVGESGPLFR